MGRLKDGKLSRSRLLSLSRPHRLEDSEDMHSLLLTKSSTLLVAGLQSHILEIDLNTVQETQKVQAWGRKDPGRA